MGQIIVVGFDFAPSANYMLCQGQTLPISKYQALFSLLGTTYGGDGQNTFALPDLRSRTPLCFGTASAGAHYEIGQVGGAEAVRLLGSQVGSHSHAAQTTGRAGEIAIPGPTCILADQGPAAELSPPVAAFAGPEQTGDVALSPSAISPSGAGEPHENRQPFQALNFAIAIAGAFPPRL